MRTVSLSVLVASSLTAVLLWSPCASGGPDASYAIGAGDVLEVQVWDNKDLNQTVFVRPDGKVSLPLVGEVAAGGRTVQQLQDELTEAYTRTVKVPQVTVLVKEIRSRPIYFIGGFTKPGVEQLTRPLTVLQAVSIAGGLLASADPENGFILRGDRRIAVDFSRLIQKGDISQNPALEVGDSIVVPLADAVYVHGEVKVPGAVKSTSDLTVLRAISQVGGVTALAATNRVEILRGQGERKERIRVDVDKLMRSPGEAPDVLLKPNDIVFVPQRLF
jgi:polysaccharide export outer membrane protein